MFVLNNRPFPGATSAYAEAEMARLVKINARVSEIVVNGDVI